MKKTIKLTLKYFIINTYKYLQVELQANLFVY